jgi:hypothetical protein
VMKVLMRDQIVSVPPPLRDGAMDELAQSLKRALHAWMDLQIPDTLGNLDINPGNVLCGANGCIFLDWREAYVGPPFLTFALLCAHREHCNSRGSLTGLQHAYREPWLKTMPWTTVERGLQLAALLSPLAYAVASPPWRGPQANIDAHAAAHLRSLTRRMRKVALGLERLGIL